MWKVYCDLITEKKIKNAYNKKELRNNIQNYWREI